MKSDWWKVISVISVIWPAEFHRKPPGALSRVAPMPVWNDKMVGQQAASGQFSVNSVFTWSILLCNGYQFCSSIVWVLQHHSMHALGMSNNIVFVYLGYNSNEISLTQATLAIPVVHISGCMLGNDLTWWPPNQILSVHCDTTGQTTLEPHWLMLSPSGVPEQCNVNLYNWNTLEDHWSHKYT